MVLYDKANWSSSKPRTTLPIDVIARIAERGFGGRNIVSAEVLAGGLANSNYRLRIDGLADPIVLRTYDRDPAACQKEVDIYRMIRDKVPVPDILYAEPAGFDGVGPFIAMQCVEGVMFRELKASGDSHAMGQAAWSAGQVLAAIGAYTFSEPGRLGPGPSVMKDSRESSVSCPDSVESCLASSSAQGRMPAELIERIRRLIMSWAPRLAFLNEERYLAHCDFNSRNLLVRQTRGRWAVSAVIDWEFAVSGSPMLDVGSFLRYERRERPRYEPHFSNGYQEAGGKLPSDWRQVTRVIDLSSLCEILTRDVLPESITAEVLDLIRATVDEVGLADEP